MSLSPHLIHHITISSQIACRLFPSLKKNWGHPMFSQIRPLQPWLGSNQPWSVWPPIMIFHYLVENREDRRRRVWRCQKVWIASHPSRWICKFHERPMRFFCMDNGCEWTPRWAARRWAAKILTKPIRSWKSLWSWRKRTQSRRGIINNFYFREIQRWCKQVYDQDTALSWKDDYKLIHEIFQ